MGGEQSRSNGTAVGVGTSAGVPPGVTTLRPNLQKRFAKGIQYNMKVIIKGDRNVGKTCLFERLQGKPFNSEYNATQEIQVACIQWNYKATDDVVKVEIWDIVDKGKTRKRDGLKLDSEEPAPTLDAEFIDVYKGTSGVIMVLDITKYWTYEYVQREIKKIPLDIPVILIASHRDLEEKRSVLTEEVHSFLRELNRPQDAAAVYYMEASMKDGFGLKYLYRFFNVPYLELQRQTLLAQLRRNEEDLEAIKVELDIHAKTEEQDYEKFKDMLERKKKGLPVSGGLCTVSAGANETAEGSSKTEVMDGSTAMSLRNRLSQQVLEQTPLPSPKAISPPSDRTMLDDFVPDGKLDNSFLGSSQTSPQNSARPSPRQNKKNINDIEISDSDEDIPANPQVTLDQESPDESSYQLPSNIPVTADASLSDSSTSDNCVMADDDGPISIDYSVPRATAQCPVTNPGVADAGVPPSQSIAPFPAVVHAQPLHEEYVALDKAEYETFNSEESMPLNEVTVEAHDTDARDVTQSYDVMSSRDDVTPSRDDVSCDTSKSHSEFEHGDPVTEDVPDMPPSQPQIIMTGLDLDALDQLSKAPPIITAQKSPKVKKKQSAKSKMQKKSMMDITISSSSEDDVICPQEVEPEVAQVLVVDEEPPLKSKPHRQDSVTSQGSLKLFHIEPSLVTAAPQPTLPTPGQPKKTKKPKTKPEKSEQPPARRSSFDELEDFLGGTVDQPPSRTKSKGKTKKKKKRKANTGDYEEI